MKLPKLKIVLFVLLLCIIGYVCKSGIWKLVVYRVDYIEGPAINRNPQMLDGTTMSKLFILLNTNIDVWGGSRIRRVKSRWTAANSPYIHLEYYNTATDLPIAIDSPERMVIYNGDGSVRYVADHIAGPGAEHFFPPWPSGIRSATKADTPAWFYNDSLFKDSK